jgi:hypothetical protein
MSGTLIVGNGRGIPLDIPLTISGGVCHAQGYLLLMSCTLDVEDNNTMDPSFDVFYVI